jgi:hypothetical protein
VVERASKELSRLLPPMAPSMLSEPPLSTESDRGDARSLSMAPLSTRFLPVPLRMLASPLRVMAPLRVAVAAVVTDRAAVGHAQPGDVQVIGKGTRADLQSGAGCHLARPLPTEPAAATLKVPPSTVVPPL